ncbi:DUF3718 domain-containing protein [Ferrimonas sp. YFM]|uniref:DUF3718 domain-containing protein n=1 Tax=Ferrimonas sp. YFM TaxID=3028878 RepID=UPI00257464FF|nr:DUF3718 domain-containing protein [Ferrimonas sp. YFM]BDY06814.1 hypothetical protein F0521_38550 [Ferrimonas sp. YFM]
MKTLLMTGLLALGTLGTATAQDRQFIAADDRIETQLCLTAVTENWRSMDRTLAHSGYRLMQVSRELKCNDIPVAVFAAQYNADPRVAKHLAKFSRDAIKQEVEITDLTAMTGTFRIEGH